ncbi:MAG: MotA/TolQ/ExbB proton channel family protein [Fibrobacteria bacterium]|nr:MotA/TolQ/ExbB proton channel family protein [Fibrobacteria bacterium]
MQSYFIEEIISILSKGGYVLIPIFVVAQIGWFFVIERLWALRKLSCAQRRFWRDAPNTPEELKIFVQHKGDKLPGLFGKLVKGVSNGVEQGERTMINDVKLVLNEGASSMQRHMSTIAVMAGSAPLLGLLGTVSGMVATFQIITQYGTGNPAMMAEGISEALLTTQAGLIVSFPLVLMHNTLLNRADTIETECITGATRLINGLR